MKLTMQDINKRIYELSHDSFTEQFTPIIYNDNGIFLKGNALDSVRNWINLDKNTNIAFSRALDIFSEVCMNCTDNDVINAYNYLYEGINKVRDHNSLANVIKVRNSRIKTKISTKINNKTEELNNALKKTTDEITAKLKSNGVQQPKKENRIILVDECFSSLLERSKEIKECDVIINNYNTISKRYNLDKIISEVCFDNEIYECIAEISKLVDTYNSPFIKKYNTALETSYFLLNKHFMNYPSDKIIEAVTDYFVINTNNDNIINDVNFVRNHSVLFNEQDFKTINYLNTEPLLESINKKKIKSKVKEYLKGNPEEHKGDDVKKILDEFRAKCATDNNKNDQSLITSFKGMITKIFTKNPDQIINEIPNIFGLFRITFIASLTAINPVLGIISIIGNKIIKMELSRKQIDKFIDAYEKEINKSKRKIDKYKDGTNTKDREERYKAQLEKDLAKLKEYRNDLYTDEENDERDFADMDDDFDFDDDEFNIDDEFNESQLTQISSILNIGNFVQSIDESLGDRSFELIVNESISSLPNSAIDDITDLALTVPNIIDKNALYESYRNEIKSIRSKNKKYTDDYIKIDCLSSNMYKLLESRNTYSSNSVNDIISYLSCLNEIANIPSNGYLLEMNFTNTIKLAINNLKRTAVKLSDKEKQLSNNIDVSMNNLSKGLEDSLTSTNREAIIRGRVLPSASKTIKIALATGAAWAISPAIAVIGALGAFACTKKLKAKERQLVLDEIEIELKMCERYLRIAEDKNDMKAVRQIEMTQRNLKRQQQRIKYKMKVVYNQKVDTDEVLNSYEKDLN